MWNRNLNVFSTWMGTSFKVLLCWTIKLSASFPNILDKDKGKILNSVSLATYVFTLSLKITGLIFSLVSRFFNLSFMDKWLKLVLSYAVKLTCKFFFFYTFLVLGHPFPRSGFSSKSYIVLHYLLTSVPSRTYQAFWR